MNKQFLFFAFLLVCTLNVLHAGTKYTSMKIYSRDIRITSITRLTLEDIISVKRENVFRKVIKDTNVLYKLSTILDECIFTDNYEGDVKIVCLLYKSSKTDK